jgi:hypothetical protein
VSWAAVFLSMIRFPDAVGNTLGRMGRCEGAARRDDFRPVLICRLRCNSLHFRRRQLLRGNRPANTSCRFTGEWCNIRGRSTCKSRGTIHSRCLAIPTQRKTLGVAIGSTICWRIVNVPQTLDNQNRAGGGCLNCRRRGINGVFETRNVSMTDGKNCAQKPDERI